MDLAILSSKIFTGNPRQPWAEALGIKQNRIVTLGSNNEIKKECNARTRILELKGRLVTPGFVDGHLHFVNMGLALMRVDLRNAASLAVCRERIRQAAAKHKPGEWILGRGWNHHQWTEQREPNRFDLDDIAPDNPVMMIRTCGHSIWLNSAALAKTEVHRDTPDPAGGRIDRDPKTGEPTGLLHEARAMLEKHITVGPETLRQAALTAQQEAFRFGLTGVHSCELLQHWDTLSALNREEKLKLRVYHTLPTDELAAARERGIKPGFGDERLWFGKIKLFADGSMGAATALLHEPYSDDPANSGIAILNVAELQKKVEAAYQAGWEVAVHAIGDKGVSNVLDAIAAARQKYPGLRRDRIEHVQMIRPSDLTRLYELGITASIQPVHLLNDRPTAERKWGLTRCRYAYAYGSMRTNRIPLLFGSDAPVESANPLLSLQLAVARRSPQWGSVPAWFPEEALTLEQSLASFSGLAAWSSYREDRLGSLSPGKWADLTVLEKDLFALAPEEWSEVKVETTIINGEVVYQKQ
ncbi:MAG: hypothetical protein EHM45_17075 [Desulfobacteraceae bacterium]|nr:MAG: hypothetical protein EHM45_17075 [Desulfobacteraceae bacterium]